MPAFFIATPFNMGLPIFESRELGDAIKEGEEITVDSAKGTITVTKENKIFSINPIPPFMEQLIADGGLMKHIEVRRNAKSRTLDVNNAALSNENNETKILK